MKRRTHPIAGMLDKVDALIATLAGDEAAQIEWIKAANVHRDHPLVAMVQQAFGWTDTEVDALFVEADAV